MKDQVCRDANQELGEGSRELLAFAQEHMRVAQDLAKRTKVQTESHALDLARRAAAADARRRATAVRR